MAIQCAMRNAPETAEEATNLGTDLSKTFSKQGWTLVSVVLVSKGVLLFTFQK